MHVGTQVRKAALLIAGMTVGLLAFAGTAAAGTITQSGATLTFTANAGDVDDVHVIQADATSITFNDDQLALTGTTANCVVAAGDVVCTGVTWTGVTVDTGDGGDYVEAESLTVPSTIRGGAGYNLLTGGTVADRIELGDGGGQAFGKAGNDTLIAGATGPESYVDLNGDAGDDLLDLSAALATTEASANGNEGNDTILGGATATRMFGSEGNDTLTGGAGSELIDGGEGLDTISGGDGDDVLDGGFLYTSGVFPAPSTRTSDGADSIAGGGGFDTVVYTSRTAAVTVDLAVAGGDGQAGENDGVALDVEGATGGYGDDMLWGSDAPNDLDGSFGKDTLDGRGGFDQLNGGGDADTINASGDVLTDLVSCGHGTSTVAPYGTDADTANLDYLDALDTTADCETVNRAAAPAGAPQAGTTGDDTLIGTGLADLLIGGLGNDKLSGGLGDDEILGGAGNDTLTGGAGNDDISGGAGNDKLSGNAGADTLAGGSGNDVLAGGAGPDVLTGGTGKDKLDGGAARDFLVARDGVKGDTVTCTKVKPKGQRDVIVIDTTDKVVNRTFCGRILVG